MSDQVSVSREECEAIIEEVKTCLDCRYCARIANSDATTPGFHYSECTNHRDKVRLARAHLALLAEVEAAWKQAKETGEEINISPCAETSLDSMICAIGDKYSELLDFSEQTIQRLEAELLEAKEKINTPEIVDFMGGVPLEAAHQRERWGSSYDVGKTATDWFWLIGYLAGKALHSETSGNHEKVKFPAASSEGGK